MKESYLHDPEKYAQMAEPFDSQREAEKVLTAFYQAVGKLREEYRIAEVVLQAQVYTRIDGEIHALSGGGGWGDQRRQAQLAKRRFDAELECFFDLHDRLMAMRPKLREEFLTDPTRDTSGPA